MKFIKKEKEIEKRDVNNIDTSITEAITIGPDMVELNADFLEQCKKNVNAADYTILIECYRKYIKAFDVNNSDVKGRELGLNNEDDVVSDPSSVDNSLVTNQVGSDMFDQLPNELDDCQDEKEFIKKENEMQNLDDDSKTLYSLDKKGVICIPDFGELPFTSQETRGHVCSKSQIYKFLVHFYGVKCPIYTKFKIRPQRSPKKITPYDWPFLDVPTKPRSVFDTGPTREEVGEYNRRIFDIVTENSFPYPRDLIYRFNPNFFDEDSDEYFTDEKQIYKNDAEFYTYDGEVFTYKHRVVLRMFNVNGLKYLSLRNAKEGTDIKAEMSNFKFVAEDRDLFIDVLFLLDFCIYRLSFTDRHQVESMMRLTE